jgi:hypothetical protein
MLESQLQQLANIVPPANQGKVPRQSEDLETANLVDIFNAGIYGVILYPKDGMTRLCQSRKMTQEDRSS